MGFDRARCPPPDMITSGIVVICGDVMLSSYPKVGVEPILAQSEGLKLSSCSSASSQRSDFITSTARWLREGDCHDMAFYLAKAPAFFETQF